MIKLKVNMYLYLRIYMVNVESYLVSTCKIIYFSLTLIPQPDQTIT